MMPLMHWHWLRFRFQLPINLVLKLKLGSILAVQGIFPDQLLVRDCRDNV